MQEISEYNSISETDDRREIIKQKLRQYYDGRIVRKDLTKSIREGSNVPVYVLNIFSDSIVIRMIRRLLTRSRQCETYFA